MRRGTGSAPSAASTRPGTSVVVASPASTTSQASHSPLSVATRSSASGLTPHFSAKAIPARVSLPSSSKATRTGGPLTVSRRSAWRAARFSTTTARRRGVAYARTAPCASPAASIAAVIPAANASLSERSAFGGSSSVPSSTSRVSASLMTRGLPVVPTRPSGSPAPRGSRNRPRPPHARACARAGCSAGAR